MHALRRLGRLARMNPLDGVDRVAERIAGFAEHMGGARPLYPQEGDWERQLHGLLGAQWPCPHAAEFPEVWAQVVSDMRRKGFEVGRSSYAGFDDADPGLARALWCLVAHLRPAAVVETGVARGLTSRVILEALSRHDGGRLWSIDLPPLSLAPAERRSQIAAAVSGELCTRWTLLEGSSRRLLRPLLRDLGAIDLFVHDSLHSTRNVRFELAAAWAALRPGGAMLLDDIDMNFGFQSAAGLSGGEILHGRSDDGRRQFGVVRRRGCARP